jgi:general secretion pathway protein D
MPPQVRRSIRSSNRTNAGSNQPPVPREDLTQGPSDLVDEQDPFMQENVGLIRIPEMGTNEVLEMLENLTRKPILRQQTLPTVKITFFSQEALTRGEAITAIESLLALNGIAITTLGEKFLKAVPSSIIKTQVARTWEGSTLGAEPTQRIYEKLFELDFLTAQEAVALIQPLMSQGAPIAFDKSNRILVTDALVNLQRLERLLPTLDKPSALRTEMLFFELENIEAGEVVQRLQQLAQGPLRRRFENNTTFEADERTNQIIAFTHPSNTDLITELMERLDIDVAPQTATQIYSIRYADATEVVNIIEQIVTGQREVRQETSGDANNNTNARRQAAQRRQNNETVAAARAEATNLQFSDFLTIVPDERANTIVASGTNNDLRYLEQLVQEIDTLLAQVRIEVVIADVTLRKNDTRGIDTFGFNYTGTGFDIDLDDPDSTWTANPGSFYGVSTGATWGGVIEDGEGTGDGENGISAEAGEFGINVVLNRIAENENAKVLSAPTIVTTHNKEAIVSVGQEVPVITGITTTDTTGTVSGAVEREQVQYRDVKLELTVTPLIGSDGVVQMEIEQQVQDLGAPVDLGNRSQPTINTRTATSFVSVKDKGMIALGGLQRLQRSNNRGRMALLGSIPVVGELFKSRDTSVERTELLIFIRPTIVRDTEAADRDANQLIDVMEGTEAIRDYLDHGTFREIEKESDEPEKEPVPRRYQP